MRTESRPWVYHLVFGRRVPCLLDETMCAVKHQRRRIKGWHLVVVKE